MNISSETIKELRGQTGAGLMDVKTALEEAEGDTTEALNILRKKGLAKLGKKADRIANEGVIASYIHAGGRIGVLIELNCETDFVARTDDFKDLAQQLALHIAAAAPQYVHSSEVPTGTVEQEKSIYLEQNQGKPAEVAEKILENRLEKFYSEICLLNQPFVKNPELTVEQYMGEVAGKIGEKIEVRRFARFVLGN